MQYVRGFPRDDCARNVSGKKSTTCLLLPQSINLALGHDQKTLLGQQSTSKKKHETSRSPQAEPMIWSCDTGQEIAAVNRPFSIY